MIQAGCAEDPRVADVLALDGDPAVGEALYGTHCSTCHGADGSGGTARAIDHPHRAGRVVGIVLSGPHGMPSFAEVLTDQELADLLAFLTELGVAEP